MFRVSHDFEHWFLWDPGQHERLAMVREKGAFLSTWRSPYEDYIINTDGDHQHAISEIYRAGKMESVEIMWATFGLDKGRATLRDNSQIFRSQSDYYTKDTKRVPRAETRLNLLDIILSTLVSTEEETDCVYHAQRNCLTMSSVCQIANKIEYSSNSLWESCDKLNSYILREYIFTTTLHQISDSSNSQLFTQESWWLIHMYKHQKGKKTSFWRFVLFFILYAPMWLCQVFHCTKGTACSSLVAPNLSSVASCSRGWSMWNATVWLCYWWAGAVAAGPWRMRVLSKGHLQDEEWRPMCLPAGQPPDAHRQKIFRHSRGSRELDRKMPDEYDLG